MDAAAKLITAIAALLGAIAWPTAILIALLCFRRQIRELLGRLRKGKLGFVEVELERIVSASAATADSQGAITAEQVETAARIEAQSSDIGQQELLRQLDKLGIEYDRIRRTMRPGPARTAAMNRVLVQMRAVGPSVASRIEAYKSSGSPGARLAAVAIMQMVPDTADIPWLVERFRGEAPFIFYHAALALQNVANDADEPTLFEVEKAANEALQILRAFDGVPDQDSMDILEAIASS